eukprot:6188402-Pyramimonas_sp.AAC.1
MAAMALELPSATSPRVPRTSKDTTPRTSPSEAPAPWQKLRHKTPFVSAMAMMCKPIHNQVNPPALTVNPPALT